MDKNPTFYQLAFITLLSYLLVHAFTHPIRHRDFRTVFLVTETIWFYFISATKPIVGDGVKHRQRQKAIWSTILFLYFFHTQEYVHPNYLE